MHLEIVLETQGPFEGLTRINKQPSHTVNGHNKNKERNEK